MEFMNNMPKQIFEMPRAELPFIEKIQFLIDQCLPGLLGLKLTKLDEEESTAYLDYRTETAGLHGLMHGGTIFSAGDTLTAMMLLKFGGNDTANVLTKSSSIRYLRPVAEGRVTVKARITKREGNTFYMVTDYFNEENKRVAQSKYTYLLVLR